MATKKNTTAKAAPKSQEQHTPRISVRIDKMLDSAAAPEQLHDGKWRDQVQRCVPPHHRTGPNRAV